jgi:phosphotransferase system enzyme I (PtsI)
VTADGVQIRVMLNISDPRELADLDPAICDGIGLVRTEFLFHDRQGLPNEEQQYSIYRRIAEWAQGRPVTLRTLDAGGDKPIPGLTPAGESNPFLGVRGLRLSLAQPDVFRTQLRALARAAMHGNVKIMLPMVTQPRELAVARSILDAEVAALDAAGIPARRASLGIMIEVPAAAIAADQFDAEFFSIGSNDLTQYVAAAGRDIGAVADLADPTQPAMLRLFRCVVDAACARNIEVSLCGDAGGDPRAIPLLLAAGLRSLSMAPALVGGAKLAVAAADLASIAESEPWPR